MIFANASSQRREQLARLVAITKHYGAPDHEELIDGALRLISDGGVRWLSTYKIIERAIVL
jgi:hypothetical protein